MNISKRMKYLFFFASLISLTSICTSCDEDEEVQETDYNLEDPRIRMVKFLNFPSSVDFVANDVESIIFNYDSISYGSDVSNIKTYFYGYTSQPTISYKSASDSEWKSFTNGSYMDFSSPLQIRSLSQDGKNSKEYRFDLRIHKYDVEAFTWRKLANLDLSAAVVSQKALTYDGVFYWFCSTSTGESFKFTSSDGVNWERSGVSSDSELVWESLSLFKDSLWVQNKEGEIFIAPKEATSFALAGTTQVDKLMFCLDNKLWAIVGDSLCSLKSGSKTFSAISELPSDFAKESIVPFTASSGYTEVGYIYATEGDGGVIWSVDYKGTFNQLVESGATIPYLVNPMVYIFGKTLGIVGGKLKDGSFSSKCYASYNSGVSWQEDWHKNLTGDLLGIENAGVFVSSSHGELLLVGGNREGVSSPIVWKGVLNQIIADENNYGTK